MKVARRAPGAGVRKPPREETAEGGRGWRGVDYGDLNAAEGVCDWSGVGSASWRKRKWLMNERRMALNAVSWRSLCGDGWISERTLPLLMEGQRARRSDLQDCDAVMRYRAC